MEDNKENLRVEWDNDGRLVYGWISVASTLTKTRNQVVLTLFRKYVSLMICINYDNKCISI